MFINATKLKIYIPPPHFSLSGSYLFICLSTNTFAELKINPKDGKINSISRGSA